MLSGIRLLDKSTSGRENMFRIEIWTKFDSSNETMVSELQEHLVSEYVQQMVSDPTTRPLNPKIAEAVPKDWLSQFKNNDNSGS